MFSCVRNFANRHKEKLFWAGLTVGSVSLLGKYVEHRLKSWQQQQADDLLEQHKFKKHYEKTLRVARTMVLKLLPKVRAMLERELSSTELLESLKSDPENKRKYWEELKMVGLSRALGCVLCGAVVASLSHVMMVTLSGNSLPTASEAESEEVLSVEVQTEYLKLMDNVIDAHLPKLLQKVVTILKAYVSTLPLNSKLTMQQLESILDEITLSILNRGAPESGPVPASESILPWSKYISDPDFGALNPEEASKLQGIFYFTVDVMGTEEFHGVVASLVETGRAYILDEVAPLYFDLSLPDGQVTGDKKSTDCAQEILSHPTNHVKSMHLVKLIPVLNNVLKSALPSSYPEMPDDTQTDYLNRIIANPRLESLAFTIYDSLVLAPK